MRRILASGRRRLSQLVSLWNPISYWRERARRHGLRAVLNLGHADTEVEQVTELQKRTIFPWLLRTIDGKERTVLDLGCGPGRFTGDLARMVNGIAIGVDPVPEFIAMAPAHPNVEYRLMRPGRIPADDNSIDMVWICLVLGGLHGATLTRTVREVERVLRADGVLFVAENTARKPDGPNWRFRSAEYYAGLLSFAPLTVLHKYEDLGEEISIMAGRSRKSRSS